MREAHNSQPTPKQHAGAGLTHLLWLPRGSSVVEVVGPGKAAYAGTIALARGLGLALTRVAVAADAGPGSAADAGEIASALESTGWARKSSEISTPSVVFAMAATPNILTSPIRRNLRAFATFAAAAGARSFLETRTTDLVWLDALHNAEAIASDLGIVAAPAELALKPQITTYPNPRWNKLATVLSIFARDPTASHAS